MERMTAEQHDDAIDFDWNWTEEYMGVSYKRTMTYEQFHFRLNCAIFNDDYTCVEQWCEDNPGHYLRFTAYLKNGMVEPEY